MSLRKRLAGGIFHAIVSAPSLNEFFHGQMKRVLLIKLTSMGDLIHALPALSDAALAHPEIEFDWAIDENFQEIARWHASVKEVIPTNHRAWRETLVHPSTLGSVSNVISRLKASHYDLVIDGQGNFKTARL